MADFVIRAAGEADIERLLEVERRAAALLLGLGTHDLLAMHSLSAQDLHDGTTQGILRVADVDGHAVGFALAGQVDGHAHLFEMDVVPGHGRRGIGSALLESVCVIAAARGLDFEDAALDWMLRRCSRDLGTLTALFERLDRASLAAQRRLTVPFLRQVLGAEANDSVMP